MDRDSAPVWVFRIVRPQEITAEIVLEVAPYRVDVVGVILTVRVLHEYRRPVDAIVGRFPWLGAPRKCELQLAESHRLDACQLSLCDRRRQSPRVNLEGFLQPGALRVRHRRRRQPHRRECGDARSVPRDEVARRVERASTQFGRMWIQRQNFCR